MAVESDVGILGEQTDMTPPVSTKGNIRDVKPLRFPTPLSQTLALLHPYTSAST